MIRRLVLLAFALIFLGPIMGLFIVFDGAVWRETFAETWFQKSVWTTVVSALISSVLATVIGLAQALPFAKWQWKNKRWQRLLLLSPYLVPNFVLAMAYVQAWNPTTGVFNSWFPFPFGLYGLLGLTLVFAIVHAPVAFLLLEEKIKKMDSSWLESARLCGASAWRVFFSIQLPLLGPSLVGAFALCFALSISSFAIPAWIGAPAKVYTLSFKIYQSVQLNGLEGLNQATALSFVLLTMALIPPLLSLIQRKAMSKVAFVGGKAPRMSEVVPQPKMLLGFYILFFAYQLISWILPVGVLVASTLVPPGCLPREGFKCFGSVTLKNYSYVLFELSEIKSAFVGSFFYGGLSALALIAISVMSLIWFGRRPGALRFLQGVFTIPVATPGAVLALGLILTLSGKFGLNFYNSAAIVVVAYVIKHMNFAFEPIRLGLFHISSALIEAARLSGAGTFSIWKRIVLPILFPEILGAFFLVLIPILGELSMSVFLASPNFRSIGTLLFDLQDYADQASAASLAVILILTVLILNELSRRLSGGRLGY